MQCSLTKDVTLTQLVLFFYLRYVTIVVGKVHDIVGEFGYYDRNESVGLSFVYHFVPTPLSHLRHAAEVLTPKNFTGQKGKVHFAQVFSFDSCLII